MTIVDQIRDFTAKALLELYRFDITGSEIPVNPTNPEFKGDYTIVLFGLIKKLRKSPDELGRELGGHLATTHPSLVTSFEVVKGFLNLTIDDGYWLTFLQTNFLAANY